MASRTAYFNGEWIDDAALAIPVGDPGFMLGVTITERLRTFAGRVWRQPEHVARLRRSAETVGIPSSVVDELDEAITQWLSRHEPRRAPHDDWSIVAFATPGSGGEPTRCVHGMPLPFARWVDDYERGVSLRTSTHRQVPACCWPPDVKCRSRMHYYLADREAESIEPGARALLLDQDGYVGEASTANVVAYREGHGIFSPLLKKVLPGVSVLTVRDLAESVGAPFIEQDLTIEDLHAADEVWIASTSICLAPVVRLDGQPIGGGTPGPAYARMMSAWNREVGVDIPAQALRLAARS